MLVKALLSIDLHGGTLRIPESTPGAQKIGRLLQSVSVDKAGFILLDLSSDVYLI